MLRKTVTVFITATLAAALLAGCGAVNVNVNIRQDGAKKDAGSSEAAADEADLASFPQLLSTDYDYSKYDGDAKYYDIHGNTWSLTDESAVQYPKLIGALKDIDDSQKKFIEDNINQYDEEAKEYAKENRDDENFYCYACTADTGLACADPEVVSLVTTWFVDFGGAHPDSYVEAYNIDAVSGQLIPLSAVISDKDGLNALLKEVLMEQYGDHDFFGLDESLSELDMAFPSSEDTKPAYVYSIAPDGLTFYFNPAVLSPHSDGGEQVYLPYDKLTDVLDERFR